MNALLVARVSMNARWKLFQKEIFTSSILKPVPIAVHALMFARLKQFTQNSNTANILLIKALIEGLLPAPVFNWVAQELPLLLGGNW